MKKLLLASVSLALVSTPALADSTSVDISGTNPEVCTVTNNGSATVALDSSTFSALNGGATVEVPLGNFDVYCNLPATLTMSSLNGALKNPINTTGFNDNGVKLIPYVLGVTSNNASFTSENFTLPAGHAAGVTGGQGFRKTKTAVNGITLDTVNFRMSLNNFQRPQEQLAPAQVLDSRFLYAGTFSETATLTIAPAI